MIHDGFKNIEFRPKRVRKIPKMHAFFVMARGSEKSLKLGNVRVFVQLIFSSRWPMKQLYKNPNIA